MAPKPRILFGPTEYTAGTSDCPVIGLGGGSGGRSEPPPERVRQHSPAHRRLQVETNQRRHFPDSPAVLDKFVVACVRKRCKAHQGGVISQAVRKLRLRERLRAARAELVGLLRSAVFRDPAARVRAALFAPCRNSKTAASAAEMFRSSSSASSGLPSKEVRRWSSLGSK